jgi:hypothetical protein
MGCNPMLAPVVEVIRMISHPDPADARRRAKGAADMRQPAGPRKSFCLAALAALAAFCAGEFARAADTKVPKADDIKKKLQDLYNGVVAPDNSTGRASVLVDVGKILDKDTKNLALKNAEFWTEAIQEGRFSDPAKKKLGQKNKVVAEELEVGLKDGKTVKTKMWYRGGAMVSGSKPAPLVVSVLDKDTDPQNYLSTAWGDAKTEYGKDWVLVAVVEGDTFPCSKDSHVLVYPFKRILDHFNIDSNRWYVEGVGAAADGVQIAATEYMSNRLAGLILRGPAKAVTNECSTLYPTLVVRGKTSDPAKAVFEAYKKIDEKNNAEVVVDDLPAVVQPNDGINAWLGQHARRAMPASWPWVTTITETDGEPWTGCVMIGAPGKRGEKTKLTVKYVRDTNSVDVQCENLGEFNVYLNDDLLDLDKEVTVFVNGELNSKKRVDRRLIDAIELADRTGEYGRIFTASLRCVVKTKVEPPAAPPGPDAKPGDKPAGDQPQPGGNPPPGNPPPGNPPPGNPPPK